MSYFSKLMIAGILALLFGAAIMTAALYGEKNPGATACQISVNNALVDIPIMAKRMDKLEARIKSLEEK